MLPPPFYPPWHRWYVIDLFSPLCNKIDIFLCLGPERAYPVKFMMAISRRFPAQQELGLPWPWRGCGGCFFPE